MKTALYCVNQGVPWDVVMNKLRPYELLAFSIIFAEFNGEEFDRETLTFKKKN